MASLVGINIDQVISVVYHRFGPRRRRGDDRDVLRPGEFLHRICSRDQAFTAAVLGGIGNIAGAVLGGFVLGLVESLGASYLSSEYKDVFTF
jgi:branched-chain amino acid transport system permease protein